MNNLEENGEIDVTNKEFTYKIKSKHRIEDKKMKQAAGYAIMEAGKWDRTSNIIHENNAQLSSQTCVCALFSIELCNKIDKFTIKNNTLYNYRFNKNSAVRNYNKNYVDKYLNAMNETKEYIFKYYSNDKRLVQSYYNYVAYHLLLIVVNYCFNPNDNRNSKEQMNELSRVCNIEEFSNSLKKCTYDELSLTRKITLFTLKNKLYTFTKIICNIRHMQFARRS